MKRHRSSSVKRPRKFSDQRAVDPAEYHCVPLEPRQGFKLILTPPEAGKINVTCFSPFMTVGEITADKHGRAVYPFIPKFDLPVGQDMAIGSILVETVTGETKKSSTVILYHSSSKEPSEAVWCYNPDEITVRLEPHQSLNVHLSEPGFESAGWVHEFDPYDTNFNFEMVEAAPSDPYHFDSTLNCHLDSVSESAVAVAKVLNSPGKRAANLVFVLDKKSAANTTRLSGTLFAGRLILTGRIGETRRVRIINIVVKISGNKKKLADFPAYRLEHVTKRGEEVVNKVLVLVNPGDNEAIDLPVGTNTARIEMVKPAVLLNEESPDLRWEIVPDRESSQFHLNVSDKPDISRWGTTFQCWEISPSIVARNDVASFAGAVFIRPVGRQVTGRRIAIWAVPLDVNQDRGRVRETTITPSIVKPFSHDEQVALRRSKRVNSSNFTYPGKIAICKDLKLTKIECKSIMDGVTTVPAETPSVTHRSHASYDSDDYHHGCGVPSLPGVNSNRNRKKNTATPVSYVTPQQQSFHDLTYHFDPADGAVINAAPGSRHALKMTCEGDRVWTTQVTNDDQIHIVESKIVKTATGEMQLAVIIQCATDLARANSLAGVLKFADGQRTKTISIRTSREGFSRRRFESDKLVNLATWEKTSTGGLGKIVRHFRHNECLVVKPHEMAYIRLTDQEHGRMYVVQRPLPDVVWNNAALDGVREKMNRDRPWIQSTGPTSLCRTITMKPLEAQNPFAKQIAKAIGERQDPVFVADIVFEHEDLTSEIEVDSPYGRIRRTTTVTKVLKYYIDFSNELPSDQKTVSWHSFEQPLKSIERVTVGEKVSVRFKSKKISVETGSVKRNVEYPWYAEEDFGSQTNLQYIKFLGLKKDEGDFVFEIDTVAPTTGADGKAFAGVAADGSLSLRFHCGMNLEVFRLAIDPIK